MICPKCKKTFTGDITTCPDCGGMLIGTVEESSPADEEVLSKRDQKRLAKEQEDTVFENVRISDFSIDDVKKKYATIEESDPTAQAADIVQSEPEVVKIAEGGIKPEDFASADSEAEETGAEEESDKAEAEETEIEFDEADEAEEDVAEAVEAEAAEEIYEENEAEVEEAEAEAEPEAEAEDEAFDLAEESDSEPEIIDISSNSPEDGEPKAQEAEKEDFEDFFSYDLDSADEPEEEELEDVAEEEPEEEPPAPVYNNRRNRRERHTDDEVREVVFDEDDMSPVVYKGGDEKNSEKAEGGKGLAAFVMLLAVLALGVSAACFVFAFTGMDPLSLLSKSAEIIPFFDLI